jgi:hypothetical protein
MTPYPLTETVFTAFAALAIALLGLWAPRLFASSRPRLWWTVPFGLALVSAVAGRLVDLRGLLALALLGAACMAARRAGGGGAAASTVIHIAMVATCAALLLHLAPGFDNPRILSNVMLGAGSQPYTKYLNFDKGVAGLFLLGIYAPYLTAHDRGLAHSAGFLWRFALVTTGVLALTLAVGYVRWDPKLPE